VNPGVLVKVVVTPVLIGSASLAGRRFGDAVGGWLVGLPLTSAPVLFFLTVERGTSFGATAAVGILAGALSQTAFALAYGWASLRWGSARALAMGTLAFLVATALLKPLEISVLATGALVVLGLLVGIRLMPVSSESRPPRKPPVWDIPLRVFLATVLVVALTSAAPVLGPRLSGLLSPFPLFAAVMTVFAHRSSGPDAARDVLRGLLFGLFAFAAFFLVAALTVIPAGIAAGLLLATLAALTVQGITLAALRRAV
jgi:hypothetical protein